MICQKCERDVAIENQDAGLCATCNKEERDLDDLYSQIRLLFLKKMEQIEATCPIKGTPITINDDIHHKMGREGFASEEKRLLNIPLLIDIDYFLAVSREGHIWIEAHYKEAVARGFTVPRSATHNFGR